MVIKGEANELRNVYENYLISSMSISNFASGLETFTGHSFTLTSTLSILYIGSNSQDPTQYTSRVTESYSFDQQRAKLTFDIVDEPNRKKAGIFYFEQSHSTAVIFDSIAHDCTKSDAEDLKRLLGIDHMEFLRNDSLADSYIIGPARLLYLIKSRKNELVYQADHVLSNVRNIQTRQYKLKVNSEFNMELYFDKDDLLLEIPLQMHLSSNKVALQINFSKFSPLLDGTQLSESQMLVLKSSAQLDRFTFPPLAKCIDELYLTKMLVHMHDVLGPTEKTKFSFQSHIKTKTLRNSKGETPLEFKLSPSIAYESQVDVLKIDEDQGSIRRRQIINFKLDRSFQATYTIGQKGEKLDESCIKTMAPVKYHLLSPLMILFGAESFVYLGKTRLRGLNAKLYATKRGSLPKWLEQPVMYKNKLKYEERRPDSANAFIILYLSDTSDSVPILMEITQYYTKHTIEFFNFQWDLDHSIQASDQFSTFDFCSDSNEKHSRVELTIKTPNAEHQEYSLMERNLALMASFQDNFHLPVSMIHDLETKFISPIKSTENNYLLIEFRVVSEKDQLIELNYLGQARENPFYDAPTRILPARTFHECLELVGSQNVDIFFGYNARKRLCVIDEGKSNLPIATRTPNAFMFSKTQSIEVYLLKHIPDENVYLHDINARWNHEQTRSKFIHESLKSKLPLFDSQVEIDRFYIEPLNDGIMLSLNSSNSEMIELDSLVFSGYSLAKSEPNRIISPASIENYNWSPLSSSLLSTGLPRMSFEQCQATCLADFNCQSFSICLHNYDAECIISKFSFRSPSIVEQFQNDQKIQSRKLSVTLENNQTVLLLKHSNCELHNKMYLGLFNKRSSMVKQSLSKRNFQPVGSREECAESCMRKNLVALRMDMTLAKNSSTLIGIESSSLGLEESHRLLKNVRSSQKELSSLFCKAFYYIDQAFISPAAIKEIESRTSDESLQVNDLTGYCALDVKVEVFEKKNAETRKLMYITSEEYRFKGDLLYEKHPGIKLAASDMSKEELASYKKVDLDSKDLVQSDLSSIRTLLTLGDNFQHVTTVINEATCALKCFLQNSGPWPSCRSFDIVKDYARTETVCLLNSITLHQAISTHRFDLIDDSSSKSIQIWHYEPRAGYLIENSPFIDESYNYDEVRLRENSKVVDFFILISIIVFAKIFGLFLGIKFGNKFLGTESEATEQRLIEKSVNDRNEIPRTIITFENINLH